MNLPAAIRCCACIGVLAMTNVLPAATTPERSAVDDRYKWDLTKMYATPDDWDAHYKAVAAMVEQFAALKGTAGQSAEALLKVLTLRDQINIQLEKLGAYAHMKQDEDMRVPASQALAQRAQTLGVKYGEASSWFQPELLQIPESRLNEWLTRPDLKIYTHFFADLLRSKAHILPAREEELLAMSGKATATAGEAFGLLSNTELRWRSVKDAEGRDVEITPSSYTQAVMSKDRRYRREAFQALHSSFLDVKNTLAATLAGTMQRDWFYAKARGYRTSLDCALDAENLPPSVYTSLLQTVDAHRNLLHRYVALKKRALKLDDVHMYDLSVNLVDIPERTYTFEQARDLVLEGIKPFGPDYGVAMHTAFASRWMDVYSNKGKRAGAYNMGTYLSPPYVLLNFQGRFHDVSTVAHELGHATQSWFAKENQPPVYAGYPMFTAEVASTAAEIVFKQYMLDRTTDSKERAFLINAMLEDMRNSNANSGRISWLIRNWMSNACASRTTTAATTSIATPTATVPPPPLPGTSSSRNPAPANNGSSFSRPATACTPSICSKSPAWI